jgi:hypothetical protein
VTTEPKVEEPEWENMRVRSASSSVYLGTVQAPHEKAAPKAAIRRFKIGGSDQSKRLVVQRLQPTAAPHKPVREDERPYRDNRYEMAESPKLPDVPEEIARRTIIPNSTKKRRRA